MPSFCQEYSFLINRLEELIQAAKVASISSESIGSTSKINNISANLRVVYKEMLSLRESTEIMRDGRPIRRIELQCMDVIAKEIGRERGRCGFSIDNNHVIAIDIRNEPKLQSLEPVKLLSSLSYIIIPESSVSDISPLASLYELRFIDIAQSQVEDISDLENSTSLYNINLWGTKVKDITPLLRLKQKGGEIYRISIKDTPAALDEKQKSDIKKLGDLSVTVDV